jgi:hypothetical protein
MGTSCPTPAGPPAKVLDDTQPHTHCCACCVHLPPPAQQQEQLQQQYLQHHKQAAHYGRVLQLLLGAAVAETEAAKQLHVLALADMAHLVVTQLQLADQICSVQAAASSVAADPVAAAAAAAELQGLVLEHARLVAAYRCAQDQVFCSPAFDAVQQQGLVASVHQGPGSGLPLGECAGRAQRAAYLGQSLRVFMFCDLYQSMGPSVALAAAGGGDAFQAVSATHAGVPAQVAPAPGALLMMSGPAAGAAGARESLALKVESLSAMGQAGAAAGQQGPGGIMSSAAAGTPPRHAGNAAPAPGAPGSAAFGLATEGLHALDPRTRGILLQLAGVLKEQQQGQGQGQQGQ